MPKTTVPLIRRADVSDTALLADLSARTFTDTFGHLYAAEDLASHLALRCSEPAWKEALQDSANAAFVAMANGEVAGYAKSGPCELPIEKIPSPALELHRLYVTHPYQGKGVAAALMEESLRYMKSVRAASAFLGVWENNPRAQRFYARYGFEVAGEYTYYVGRHADRELIMRKIFPGG